MSDPEDAVTQADQEIQKATNLLAKFRCPICDEIAVSKVREGREADGYYWRRRQCLQCDNLFTTKEVVFPIDSPRRTRSHRVPNI